MVRERRMISLGDRKKTPPIMNGGSLVIPTNNNKICSIDWTNVSKLLLTVEEFFNLPNTETIIELQFKTNDKKIEARLHYMALY